MEKKVCPSCNGKKVIVGNCECNSEWRQVDDGDEINDCICDPDVECPQCKGTGHIEE